MSPFFPQIKPTHVTFDSSVSSNANHVEIAEHEALRMDNNLYKVLGGSLVLDFVFDGSGILDFFIMVFVVLPSLVLGGCVSPPTSLHMLYVGTKKRERA
jgi:hypothetical protein